MGRNQRFVQHLAGRDMSAELSKAVDEEENWNVTSLLVRMFGR